MFRRNTCSSFISFSNTLWRNSTRSFIKFTSFNFTHVKNFPVTKPLVASAAVIGITIYFAHKDKISCDIDLITTKTDEVLYENSQYEKAIQRSRDIMQRIKDEYGIPGLVIGVSIDGKTIWKEGFGFADVENRVLCTPDTVMRIASISKSITMAAVAKLWEQGKLDLDKPVQEYVPSFPLKSFNGKPVIITCRQLVSHLGGIRHYTEEKNESKKTDSKMNNSDKVNEMDLKEYYMTVKYNDILTALDLFKDDPLVENPGEEKLPQHLWRLGKIIDVHKGRDGKVRSATIKTSTGTKFLYSTHSWTLISAIVEAVAKEQFTVHITKLFKTLGLNNTYLDENDVLIYNRSRNYMKNKKGHLINAPFVDNSYKWAGGGFLSTVGDLLQFANAMLYSLQVKESKEHPSTDSTIMKTQKNMDKNINIDNLTCNTHDQKQLPGFLTSKTVEAMWEPVYPAVNYGMGWSVFPQKQEYMFCNKSKFCVFHTGGAVGASSVLLIVPETFNKNEHKLKSIFSPKGIVVVILTNMHSISLYSTALKIAQQFEIQ